MVALAGSCELNVYGGFLRIECILGEKPKFAAHESILKVFRMRIFESIFAL